LSTATNKRHYISNPMDSLKGDENNIAVLAWAFKGLALK
jgi:hypothetical protein